MSEENSFAPSTEPAPRTEDTPENFLEALVGEGKKYATVDDLAKGAYNAQAHISKLETERINAPSIEELLNKLDERKTPIVEAPLEPKPQPTTPAVGEPEGQNLEEMIRKVLEDKESVQTKSQNYETSVTTLDKHFGSRAATNEAVAAKAAELGTPVSWLKASAETNPKAFYALMGLNSGTSLPKDSTPNAPAPRGLNTLSLNSQQASTQIKPNTRAWYKQLQKTDLKKYRSPAVQRQMFDDLERDPIAFRGG